MSEGLNLEVMSAEEMWQLHGEISQHLTVRLTSEKRQLERRLAQRRGGKGMRRSEPSAAQSRESEPRAQRKYPRVFQNTAILRSLPKPGRGAGNNRDGWLLLKTAHTIEEFVTSNAASNKNNKDTRHRVGA